MGHPRKTRTLKKNELALHFSRPEVEHAPDLYFIMWHKLKKLLPRLKVPLMLNSTNEWAIARLGGGPNVCELFRGFVFDCPANLTALVGRLALSGVQFDPCFTGKLVEGNSVK